MKELYQVTCTDKEQQFINAYLEAIDFTETGDLDQPETGSELEAEFMRESIIDCLSFYNHISGLLPDDVITQAGHDFWLTRNHHGAGFWDRPEIYGKDQSEKFTKIAESYGEVCAFYE